MWSGHQAGALAESSVSVDSWSQAWMLDEPQMVDESGGGDGSDGRQRNKPLTPPPCEVARPGANPEGGMQRHVEVRALWLLGEDEALELKLSGGGRDAGSHGVAQPALRRPGKLLRLTC